MAQLEQEKRNNGLTPTPDAATLKQRDNSSNPDPAPAKKVDHSVHANLPKPNLNLSQCTDLISKADQLIKSNPDADRIKQAATFYQRAADGIAKLPDPDNFNMELIVDTYDKTANTYKKLAQHKDLDPRDRQDAYKKQGDVLLKRAEKIEQVWTDQPYGPGSDFESAAEAYSNGKDYVTAGNVYMRAAESYKKYGAAHFVSGAYRSAADNFDKISYEARVKAKQSEVKTLE